MSLNYAEKWAPEILAILNQGCLTAPFITSNVRWLDNKTFHFTQMGTSGYKTHSRNGGWNRGELAQTDVPYTILHDRDVEFFIDKADVIETNGTAKAENISMVFAQTQQVPEIDAYFYSKVAKVASTEGLVSKTLRTAYTKENVYTKLKELLAKAKLKRYRANGSLILYIDSEIMDLLELSTELTKKVEVTQINEGGLSIESRVTAIDTVPIIEVIDNERFYDDFDFNPENGGFAPKETSNRINALAASVSTVLTVPRIDTIFMFAPGQHQSGDGWIYQNRSNWDTFVMPNGLNGDIDSIYVDIDSE